ncbi:MAG: electron transfer flavoprotein subunit alpha, partial [Clostridiales bacterium]|nr:electron transfer flavoprotein subunit alpha [Clostridiales bacterium]
MSKLNQVWVIASAKATIADLTGGAAALGENVALLLAGDRENTVNAGTVYYFGPTGDQASFLSYLPAMVALVKEKKPDLILADLTPNGRIAAGQIAAAVGTNVMTDISALWLEDGRVLTQRMVYGGSAYKTERAGAVAVA